MAEIGFGDEKGVWSKMCSLQENRVLVEKTGRGGENYFWDEKKCFARKIGCVAGAVHPLDEIADRLTLCAPPS